MAYGKDLRGILTAETLVGSGDAFPRDVKYHASGAASHSTIINGNSGTIRWVTSRHQHPPG